ncbi:MAG: DUF2797 domain-containing protein [bacterium]
MSYTQISGRLKHFAAHISDAVRTEDALTARYQLVLDDQTLDLHAFLGCGISFRYQGQTGCIACDASSSRLYGGGYCYPCFSSLARCDLCIVSPERCHLHLGTCREPEWGDAFCMQPHTVYLANTSGTKVGLTRTGRERKRWLDQGAEQAIAIIRTPSRRSAGYIEQLLKRQLSDKTNWRQLVTGIRAGQDLSVLASMLRDSFALQPAFEEQPVDDLERAQVRWIDAPEVVTIQYPVMQYSPAQRLKVTPAQPVLCDNLLGIVGQYLLLTQGVVFLPDYRGLALDITITEPFDMTDSHEPLQLVQQDSLF